MPAPSYSRSSARSDSSSGSSYGEHSSRYSASTVATAHSTHPLTRCGKRVSDSYDQSSRDDGECSRYEAAQAPRTSVETFASSSRSAEDLDEDLPPFDVPDGESETGIPAPLSSSPLEFADYFPSTHRMSIKHDDSTLDGNMNLRVDTLADMSDGTQADMTLFHLRMHDLKGRDFSLRRHCRDSGREVCHATRKYQKPSLMRRPGLQRSMSNALSSLSLRTKSEHRAPTLASMKTQDSERGSLDEEELRSRSSLPGSQQQANNHPKPTDTTVLDFSNYAHLEVKRRGAKASKRYEFEYWGTPYAWKRVATASGDFKEISYHLVNTKTAASVAHVVPVPLSHSETQQEAAKGGWVPPCSMWISDESILDQPLDVADVVVATGLIALVDDCIKTRWHQKRRVQMTIPMLGKSTTKATTELVSPKRILDEVFPRREPFDRTSRPLRQTSY